MRATRRDFLAAIGVAAIAPEQASATDADQAIGHALDEAAALPPDRALMLLDPLSVAGANPGRRLDLEAARAGLRIDCALAGTIGDGTRRFALQLQRAVGDDARLDHVARDLDAARHALEVRATALFDRLGVRGRSVGARYEILWRDPRHLFSDDEAGRDAAVASMRETLAAIRPRLPRLIGPLPPQCRAVEPRALTPAEIRTGKGGYRILPTPGTTGAYVVDLRDIGRRPRFSLPSVVAHELLPGHMAQLPLEAMAAPHPLRIRYAAAFAEGWASYAEMMMASDGLFATPVDELGHIHWMLFRMCRGLVDIALHGRGEDMAQARHRMIRSMGEPAYFASFDDDLARIAREPALRAAEAWLALRLVRARPRQLWRWPDFHQSLLRSGRVRTEALPALNPPNADLPAI